MIAKETIEMKLKNSYISKKASPGQFIHINIPNYTLRRPISIASIDDDLITIIFKVLGDGTEKLASFNKGDRIQALGPCGNGFEQPNKSDVVLLVGGGVGIPPLHYLGTLLSEKNINIISVLGFQTKESVFYEHEFKKFSKETIIVTDDGSYGEKGFVTDVIPAHDTFNKFYTCGPMPMLRAVTNLLDQKVGYISLEERMGCGVGACYACVVPTHDNKGYRKICQDGPVFSAKEVILS